MNVKISKEDSKRLWRTSWLVLLSALYGIYKKKYFLSLIPIIVFFTSINYWKDGNNINTRKIDIVALFIGFIINLGYAQYLKNALIYYITVFTGIIFWIIGNLLYIPGMFSTSIMFHQLFQIFGSLSNTILYSVK